MKNIDFGNYLYELRKKADLTQRFVASNLGLSDKAVSKWETGKSMPDLTKLKLLAALYNVSLEELLDFKEKSQAKITKIVLTGGPCAGKTTALSWINNYFSKRGYVVIFIPETATELITNGVTPWNTKEYQIFQLKMQKSKEQIYESAAKAIKTDKILMVLDRGVLDSKAYMTEAEFKKVLRECGTSEVKERDSYDAIFHLNYNQIQS